MSYLFMKRRIRTAIKAAALCLGLALVAGCGVPAIGLTEYPQATESKINQTAPSPTVTADKGGSKLTAPFTLTNLDATVPIPESITDKSAAKNLAGFINRFGWELTNLIDEGESFIFSPLSAYLALASFSNGSVGSAYEQMKAVLYPAGLDIDSFNKACGELTSLLTRKREALDLRLASLIVTDDDYVLNPDFALRAKESFLAETATADFADPTVIGPINEWISAATEGLIPEFFTEPLKPDTAVLLASSLYFSGKWTNAFSESNTMDAVFHGTKADQTVPMMKKEGNMPYFENEMLQATRQTYIDGAYMDIFLPKDGFTVEDILGSLSELEPVYELCSGTLKLPKFTLDFSAGLEDALKALGITDVFDGGLENLATGPEMLYLSSASQSARIEVDEEGTKAAAVTVMIASATSIFIPAGTFEMICDRPFVYTISVSIDGQAQILFIGCVRGI